MLVLDPRICWSKKAFDDVAMWKDCKSELKTHCRECCVQTKSYERHKSDNNDNEQSPDHTDRDEDDDSEQESDADTRFGFQRIVPDEFPLNNKHVSEAKKRINDDVAADDNEKNLISTIMKRNACTSICEAFA